MLYNSNYVLIDFEQGLVFRVDKQKDMSHAFVMLSGAKASE
jgi:hypothetical protein